MAQQPGAPFRWLDMSPHGMKLMAVGLPTGKNVLVVEGGEKAPEAVAKLGFVFHERSGYYILPPGGHTPSFSEFIEVFPQARRIQAGDPMPDGTVVTKEAFYRAPSSRPQAQEAVPAVAAAPVSPAGPPPVQVLLGQSSYLGRNKLGYEVYENVRGRFMRPFNGDPVFETDRAGLQPGLFFRATDEAQLAIAADGFAGEIETNGIMRLADLRRFATAVYGSDVAEDDPRLASAHAAIEGALARWLAAKGGKTMGEIFRGAQRLHEAHPYVGDLLRHQPSMAPPMPQPVSIAVQRVLGTESDVNGKKVVVTGAGAGTLFAHIGRGAELKVFEADKTRAAHVRQTLAAINRPSDTLVPTAPDYSGADMVVANLEPGLLDAHRDFDGLTVSRADQAEMLDNLEARSAEGRSVFILRGASTPEEQEEIEHVRKHIGMRYYVDGTVDIDGGLHCGRPDEAAMRVYVVGARRKAVLTEAEWRSQAKNRPSGAANHAALDLTVANDWNAVWSWTNQQIGRARKQIADFAANIETDAPNAASDDADPSLAENSFQAPYASMSAVGQASTMVPRNLEGALREAQGRVVKRHGDIDAWVANELAMTRAQLEERFAPEQVDAVAMAIDAEERGRAFLNADQTGVGKGRFLAAMMRRWIMQAPANEAGHRKVVFLTERAINISDIWRDIMHTGSEEEFATLIMNDGVDVIDERDGSVVMSSPSRLMVKALAHLRHWPDGTPVTCHVLTEEAAARHGSPEIFLLGDAQLPPGIAANDIEKTHNWAPFSNIVLATYSQFNKLGAHDEEPAQRGRGRRRRARPRAQADTPIHDKSAWLRTAVDRDTLLVIDECHNVSSGTSNISANVKAAIQNCGNVLFSSATFAKAAKNMEIYEPLFPPDFDTENLTEVMRRGGETLQETLSSMLVKDGVMIRREHDLSKCEFSVLKDDANTERNRSYMDALAPILAEMAYLSGDLDQRVNQINNAREAEVRRRVGPNDQAVRARMRSLQVNRIGFGSPLYHLSRLFVCSLLADRTAEDAIESLRNNKKPVILVENTIQSVLEELAQTQDEVEGSAMPDFKDLLRRTLSQMTRVTQIRNGRRVAQDIGRPDIELDTAELLAERLLAALPATLTNPVEGARAVKDYRGKVAEHLDTVAAALRQEDGTTDIEVFTRAIARVRTLIEALPEAHAEGIPALQRLPQTLPPNPGKATRRILEMIDGLPSLPASAIDYVRDRITDAGFSCEEITGRSWECREGRIGRRATSNKTEIKNRFNSGATDALIINTAGSTGIDLHAGARFADQRKRVMIVQQPPADITKQIQAYGRVNRYDQVQGPEIHLLMAGLPIELRLLAMLNSKLRRLSANVTSNRDNSSLIRNIPDLMNTVGDEVCTRYFEARPDLERRLGFDIGRNARAERNNQGRDAGHQGEDNQDNQRSANECLARLAMLPVAMQEQVMAELEAEYRATIEEYDAKGDNPLKTKTIEGQVFLGPKGLTVFDGADVDNPESQFDLPVYSKHIIIKHDVEPIRGNQLSMMFERGLVELGADGPERYSKLLSQRREMILSTWLPRGAANVQDALAQENPVMVDMNNRLGTLIDTLAAIKPGSEVNLMLEGTVEQGVVTRLFMAKRGYEHLASNYEVEIVVPGDSMPRRITLGSLLRDEKFGLSEGMHGDDADAIVRKFDTALNGGRAEQRYLLVGNEWRAMNLAIANKLGSMTTYIDENGVRSRGVLVNKGKTDGLLSLPVQMNNAQQASEAIVQAKADLYSSSKLDGVGVLVKPTREGRFVINMPDQTSAKWDFIYRHPPIQALVARLNLGAANGNNARARNKPQLQVAAEGLPTVLGHLMDAGVKFYVASRHRAWSNEWVKQNYVGEQAEEDVAAPAAAA